MFCGRLNSAELSFSVLSRPLGEVVADTAARRERLDKLCEPIMRPFKRILAALPPLPRFPCRPFGHVVSAKESAIKKTPMRRAKRKQSLGVLSICGMKAGPRPVSHFLYLPVAAEPKACRRRRRADRKSCRPGFRRSPAARPRARCWVCAVFQLSASVAVLAQL